MSDEPSVKSPVVERASAQAAGPDLGGAPFVYFVLCALALACVGSSAMAADPPLAEKYKHAGSAALFAGYYDVLIPRCGLRSLDWAVSLTLHVEEELRTFPEATAAQMGQAFEAGQRNGEADYLRGGCAAVRVSDMEWADRISNGTGKLVPGFRR